MVKPEKFEITFENGVDVYYGGSVIKGRATIIVPEPMELKKIKLIFQGKANVKWSETRSSGQATYTVTYSAEEVYFKSESVVYGKRVADGYEESELPKGQHEFPFEFNLPPTLPSSFEGRDGHVRYTVKCEIDRPWRFDTKTKKAFTVLSVLDLNSDPKHLNRAQASNQKNLCCLCCKSGPIEASVDLERTGYVPGDVIKVFADISNGASRKMSKTYVELKMLTRFHATNKSRTDTKVIATLYRPRIKGHSEDSWSGEQIVIPPLPPSHLAGCNIIDIDYIVQLNVDPAGPALDLEVQVPIVIGTVPLTSVVAQLPRQPPAALDAYAVHQGPSAPPVPVLPSNLPPMSYNETSFGRVSIKENDDDGATGDLSFAPAYAYYNWGFTPEAGSSNNNK